MSRTTRPASAETTARRHATQANTILRRRLKTMVGGSIAPASGASSGKQLFGMHEAHARLTRGEVDEGAHHVLERRVDFPIVRGEAEVPAGPLRLLEMLLQGVDAGAGHEAVTPEFRMAGIPERVRV